MHKKERSQTGICKRSAHKNKLTYSLNGKGGFVKMNLNGLFANALREVRHIASVPYADDVHYHIGRLEILMEIMKQDWELEHNAYARLRNEVSSKERE